MNIDYKLLEKQRNHLLSILWDDLGKPVLLDRELGWGIVHLLDDLLDEEYYKNKKDLTV